MEGTIVIAKRPSLLTRSATPPGANAWSGPAPVGPLFFRRDVGPRMGANGLADANVGKARVERR